MQEELKFRIACALILAVTVMISGYHRAKARRASAPIARHMEGPALMLLRFIFALPIFAMLLLYVAYPRWVTWSQVTLPTNVRWAAVLMAAATIPFTLWVFRSLGTNVSETILTKSNQNLVTWGPYRWIRHPLYAGAAFLLVALSVVAANWFMALLVFAVLVVLPSLAKREESHLLAKFGSAYAEYMARTGRFAPKFRAHRSAEG